MPAVGLSGLSEQPVVRLRDTLRLLVAGPLQLLGGAYQVGEEDGDSLSSGRHKRTNCSTDVQRVTGVI
jgi:hypothetical protein